MYYVMTHFKNATWRWSEPTCQSLVDLQFPDSKKLTTCFVLIWPPSPTLLNPQIILISLIAFRPSCDGLIKLCIVLLWHQHVYSANITAGLRLETCQLLCCLWNGLLPGFEFWSSDTRQTDRLTDGQKAMHKSPPCLSTGVLKKEWTTSLCHKYLSLLYVHYWLVEVCNTTQLGLYYRSAHAAPHTCYTS